MYVLTCSIPSGCTTSFAPAAIAKGGACSFDTETATWSSIKKANFVLAARSQVLRVHAIARAMEFTDTGSAT